MSGKRVSWPITSWVIPAASRRSLSSEPSAANGTTISDGPRACSRRASRSHPIHVPAAAMATSASKPATSAARTVRAPRARWRAAGAMRPRTGGRRPLGRGPLRRCRRALLPFEMRDVATLRDGDPHRVVAAGIDVVAVEVAAQPPRLEPHDRVGAGIEAVVAAEDLGRDREALQPVGAARERLVDQETQQITPPRTDVQRRSGEQPLKLNADVLRQGRCRQMPGRGIEDVLHRLSGNLAPIHERTPGKSTSAAAGRKACGRPPKCPRGM